jgi:rubrerythrin
MPAEKAVEIIKGAILLETKGKAFYKKTAEQTASQAVKDFFENMAMEEDEHIKILSEQFKSLVKDGSMSNVKLSGSASAISASVLSEKIKKEIDGAGYEAAAISAAIAMEDKAVSFYSDRAQKADDPAEKDLYNWLANWEKGHLNLLMAVDKELQESIWNDNQFWPM